jgi:hypothetical protein
MPVKIQNSFSPTTEIGAALNNAITGYYNNTPTYGEAQAARIDANKADAPRVIGERIKALYGSSGGAGQPLTPQMVQDQIAGLAEATAMGGDVGKLGEMLRTVVANSANPESVQMIDRAQQGAGQAYNTTETGFNTAQKNDLAKVKMQQDGANYRANVAASATQMSRKEQEKLNGKKSFENVLDDISSQYDKLAASGGVVDTTANPIKNFLARTASSGGGQLVGEFVGTENQSARNQIKASLPLLKQAVMSATGMSAKQMDSNVEMKAFMEALTDPQKDIQATRAIISRLSRQFGTGGMDDGGGGPTGVDVSGVNNSPISASTAGPVRKVIDGVAYVNYTGQPEDWEEE